ncbi:hypothetical protein [Actinomadura kijaniata]|uniref:hypothetical protein n=1 Tax=Actinomadura kijaniata TaxID=46161 RepID=UPI000831FC20|nr:hypothetical protein [Actinomadura kijaniata]
MDHRSRIRRRLRSLAGLELFNIPFQAAVWFGSLGLPLTAANATGFALVALVLLEGAAYWAAKLRRLRAPGGPLPFATAFASARLANPPLLAAGVAFTTWSVVMDPGAGTIPGLGFAVFGVLEHVNYFHTQLMYDTREDLRHLRSKGFRRSHLARDLERRSLTPAERRERSFRRPRAARRPSSRP